MEKLKYKSVQIRQPQLDRLLELQKKSDEPNDFGFWFNRWLKYKLKMKGGKDK